MVLGAEPLTAHSRVTIYLVRNEGPLATTEILNVSGAGIGPHGGIGPAGDTNAAVSPVTAVLDLKTTAFPAPITVISPVFVAIAISLLGGMRLEIDS